METKQIRVLVADDHPVVREGLISMVNRDHRLTVVAEAKDGADAVKMYDQHLPDITLMDLRMPGLDGIQATREIRKRYPAARIIVLTTFDMDDYVYRALKHGAKAYVLKDQSRETLIDTIEGVYLGLTKISPELLEKLTSRLAGAELSERELDVLRLIVKGRSNKDISAELFITVGTVKSHVNNLLTKLDAMDRTQAVHIALTRGIVEL